MHHIDDCLFKTSVSISIEGDADMSTFDAQMEQSFQVFMKMLDLNPLIASTKGLYAFSEHKEVFNEDIECIELTLWFLRLQRSKQPLSEINKDGSLALNIIEEEGYPNWVLRLHFKLNELHEAFAIAINEGRIIIPYKGTVLRNYGLCFCFELETVRNIYQYYWRSRWVLTLVNFLINSQKTSLRIFPKGAEIIRRLGTRLFKKPSGLD